MLFYHKITATRLLMHEVRSHTLSDLHSSASLALHSSPPDSRGSHSILTGHLLLHIFIANAPLDRGACGDTIDPLQQMREGLHLVGAESAPLPTLHPRPRLNVRDRVLALSSAREPVTRLTTRVDARETDLEHAVHS